MPYIKQESRDLYDQEILLIVEKLQDQGFPEGDVTYILYKFAKEWWNRSGRRFKDINHIIGSLTNAKDEFRESVVKPYEAMAREKNGDI